MSVKKVLSAIFPFQTINFRNLVSLLLIALFIFVYYLCGGRIVRITSVQQGTPNSSFGGGYRRIAPASEVNISGDIKKAGNDVSNNAAKSGETRTLPTADQGLDRLRQRLEKSK